MKGTDSDLMYRNLMRFDEVFFKCTQRRHRFAQGVCLFVVEHSGRKVRGAASLQNTALMLLGVFDTVAGVLHNGL